MVIIVHKKSMKAMKLVLGLLLAAGLVGVVGCKKEPKGPEPGAPMVIDGVSVDLPKLITSLEGATQEQQATVRNVQMAFRYRQFDKAMMELDKLANDSTLNEEQKKLASQVLEQVKELAQKSPPQEQ
jgi:hypothetical protein